ncbi:TDP-N-acetylfucosamine:lipid II N-acetylfucosaminyltransferase [Aegicerativicinus sediminis]|uniref:TDP-N-acetylfucosamine:lipid II N-acetylfucosaminyltransferase n=1 Tax=Aegicerativicinus sediminis TaxID=2893202 RepID=UPI001E391C92|nr:TDP-N-acetylfucosamine:lipid II N-acetylfucosaminyltransferase [Aegicerativicinus sediminis]
MRPKYKILHLCNDEKFIDPVISSFEEVYPGRSIYYILQTTEAPFKYVTSSKAERFLIQTAGDEQRISEVLQKNNIKVIFLHALDQNKQRIVNSLDIDVLKVWFIWGSDLYWNWKLLKQQMFERDTFSFLYGKDYRKSLRRRLTFNNSTLWFYNKYRSIHFWLPKALIKKLENNFLTEFYKSVHKIDVVVPIVPMEFNYVSRINPKLVEASFAYGNIEDLAAGITLNNDERSKHILIGNSASPTNNHVDAFKLVEQCKKQGQKVIVPLSYGGKKNYVDFVIKKGKQYFGEDFMPILNFMPLQEYNKLISNCGFAVFYHRRQQALGNINTMLYIGAKVFLNGESPIFKYFNKVEIKVFNLGKIDSASFQTYLSPNGIEYNRTILFRLYSKEAARVKVSELLSIVNAKLNDH